MNALSDATWSALVACARRFDVAAWAAPGVFAPAIGPGFAPGQPNSVLYIGKAGGPLIDSVGIGDDQARSAQAATRWMIERRNPSAFWVFADLLVDRREDLAWSNLAKIDNRLAGPPGVLQWTQIKAPCLRALREEMQTLRPGKTVFATSDFGARDLGALLREMAFVEFSPREELDKTRCFRNREGRLAVMTRHPQGWQTAPRNAVAAFARNWRPD